MMQKFFTCLLVIFATTFLIFAPVGVGAQQPEGEGGTKSGTKSSTTSGQDFGISQGTSNLKLRNDTPAAFIGTVIRWVLGIIGVVLVAVIVYAGVLYATSAGNEDQTATAKRTLTYAIIGLVLVVSAFLISDFVLATLEAPGEVVPQNTGL